MVVLLVSLYVLIGCCVYIAAISKFRKDEWLTYSDLFEIAILFLFCWPIAVMGVMMTALQDSELSYKILKFINGERE